MFTTRLKLFKNLKTCSTDIYVYDKIKIISKSLKNLLDWGATSVHQVLYHLVVTIPVAESKSQAKVWCFRHGDPWWPIQQGLRWSDLQDSTRGVAPLVLAATRRCTSSLGRWSRNTCKCQRSKIDLAKVVFCHLAPIKYYQYIQDDVTNIVLI